MEFEGSHDELKSTPSRRSFNNYAQRRTRRQPSCSSWSGHPTLSRHPWSYIADDWYSPLPVLPPLFFLGGRTDKCSTQRPNVATSSQPWTGLFLQVNLMQTTSEQLCGRRSDFHLSNKEPYIELSLEGRFMQSRMQSMGTGCSSSCSGIV